MLAVTLTLSSVSSDMALVYQDHWHNETIGTTELSPPWLSMKITFLTQDIIKYPHVSLVTYREFKKYGLP